MKFALTRAVLLIAVICLALAQQASATCTCSQCTCFDEPCETGVGSVGSYAPKPNESSPDGKCYFSFHSDKQTWPNAKTKCEAEGRQLATFQTQDRKNWLAQFALKYTDNKQQVWTGGQKCSDNVKWCWLGGGSPSPFWGPGSPSGDGTCVSQILKDQGLNDASCSLAFQYVCMDRGC